MFGQPEDVSSVRLVDLRGRGGAGVALFAALLAGGGGSVVLRQWTVFPTVQGRGGLSPTQGEPASRGREQAESSGLSDLALQILRTEPGDSTVEDRGVVWSFLFETGQSKSGDDSVNWLEVDEALTWIRGASVAVPEIEFGLLGIARDPSLLETSRCLALQHLGIWAEKRSLTHDSVEKLRAIAEDFRFAGTASAALRVLNRLRSTPEEDRWLRDRIPGLLGGADCSAGQRVAALQIAVELGVAEVEADVRRLTGPGRQLVERVNAFVALASLGDRDTLRWILSQPEPTEILVREARQSALNTLGGR